MNRCCKFTFWLTIQHCLRVASVLHDCSKWCYHLCLTSIDNRNDKLEKVRIYSEMVLGQSSYVASCFCTYIQHIQFSIFLAVWTGTVRLCIYHTRNPLQKMFGAFFNNFFISRLFKNMLWPLVFPVVFFPVVFFPRFLLLDTRIAGKARDSQRIFIFFGVSPSRLGGII